MQQPVLEVSQLNRYAKAVLARDEGLRDVVVHGEVANFRRNAQSGHWYFTLRDTESSVRCVLFRRSASLVGFVPQDGMSVLAYANATLYERDGSFQLTAGFLKPYGAGAQKAAFEQLRQRLEQEGLFAPERKRPLPRYPAAVGVVTSPTGAALQDVKTVLERRWPAARLLLSPALMQGSETAKEVSQAVAALERDGRAEVILITRGGGSQEDLWAFNSEALVRRVAACRVPVVSAVGHEIDTVLLDFAADMRAPTPSAAAELCVPDKREALARLAADRRRGERALRVRLYGCEQRLAAAGAQAYGRALRQKLAGAEEGLAKGKEKLALEIERLLQAKAHAFTTQVARARALDPYAVLQRGYALVRSAETGRPLRIAELQQGRAIELCGQGGTAKCTVDEVRLEETHV